MSYATILSVIHTAIDGVDDVGAITDYEPETFRQETLNTLIRGGKPRNGWFISRTTVIDNQQDAGFRFQIIHNIVVKCRTFVNKDAASEILLQTLVDAVREAIRGSIVIWVEHPEDNSQAMQVDLIGTETWAAHLVHVAEMTFSVEEVALITS